MSDKKKKKPFEPVCANWLSIWYFVIAHFICLTLFNTMNWLLSDGNVLVLFSSAALYVIVAIIGGGNNVFTRFCYNIGLNLALIVNEIFEEKSELKLNNELEDIRVTIEYADESRDIFKSLAS